MPAQQILEYEQPMDSREHGSLPARVRQCCVLLLIAAGIYQCVLALTSGMILGEQTLYGPYALAICAAVLGFSTSALVSARQRGLLKSSNPIIAVAGVMFLLQIVTLSIQGWFFIEMFTGTQNLVNYRLILGMTGPLTVIGAAALSGKPWIGKAWLPAIVTVHFAMSCFAIYFSSPGIDVYMFHQESAQALIEGKNPYAITFKNLYGEGTPFYSKEIQKDGRVLFGFPYPPMSFWAYLPSYVVTKESRYAHAIAFALAGVLIWMCGHGRVARCAAVLLFAAPAGWKVIQMAWTEPFLMATLGLVAVAAVKKWRWLPVFIGLFLAMKQYTIIYLPLLYFLLPRPFNWNTSLRFIGVILLTGAVVSLPLALWDWGAFWNSNITIQMKQPFRFDALSYVALYANLTNPPVANPFLNPPPEYASVLPFLMLIPAWLLSFLFLPRNVAGFVLGVAFTTLMFLFFNRQSFLNYHTFAAYALLLAVATFEAVYGPKNQAAPAAG